MDEGKEGLMVGHINHIDENQENSIAIIATATTTLHFLSVSVRKREKENVDGRESVDEEEEGLMVGQI